MALPNLFVGSVYVTLRLDVLTESSQPGSSTGHRHVAPMLRVRKFNKVNDLSNMIQTASRSWRCRPGIQVRRLR